MKLTITADLHLSTQEAHPERYQTLKIIVQEMKQVGSQHLVVAGDLFDADFRNYAGLDAFCQQHKDIQFIILPGNHDKQLKGSSFTSENIRVYEKPEIWTSDLMSLPILFVPYQKNNTMGQLISEESKSLQPGEWILISHGDWIEGTREPNPLEPGIYMPLNRVDVERYQPVSVLLGHIHKPLNLKNIFYTGSPCPLHINETGRRRICILDTETGNVSSHPIDSPLLYFQASFVVYPVEDEKTFITNQIKKTIESWGLAETDKEHSCIKVQVVGYSKDKKQLRNVVVDCFSEFSFYRNSPVLDQVFDYYDPDRAEIADRVWNQVQQLQLQNLPLTPDKDTIFLQALHAIYGD